MIYKIIFITIFIPSVINLLFVLSLNEKVKIGIVHNEKILHLYVPCGGTLLFSLGSFFNFKYYINGGCVDKETLAFSIFLFIFSILSLIMVFVYRISIIKYDNEKLLYRGKWYYYNEICSLGNNDNDYIFLLNNGKKIKFSILAVGSNELCKAYLNYKKK